MRVVCLVYGAFGLALGPIRQPSLRARRLPEKLFVIHQFTDGMIQDKAAVLPRRGLAVTFNVDGFGDRPNKLSKYAAFTAQTRGRPFDDGYKLQDQNGLVFSIDFPFQLVWTSRANAGVYSGLTES